MSLKVKIGKPDYPTNGDTIYVYYANTTDLVPSLKSQDGLHSDISNPFVIPVGEDWWGFEPSSADNVDVWWEEGDSYIIKDTNVANLSFLDDPLPQYLTYDEGESDPIFTAWDKSSGIEITKSQVSDWESLQEPLVSGTNIKTINGESVLGSGDLILYGEIDESDPIFTAWDKSSGIEITKSQVSDWESLQEPLVSGTNIKTINGESVLGSGDLAVSPDESDPIFTAWDKSSGIEITLSQITDYNSEGTIYQDELISGTNIKKLNGYNILGSGNLDPEFILEETDPIFTAWDKSSGISITESQITDFTSYQEQLVSGVNIKTINGQSLLTDDEFDMESDSGDNIDLEGEVSYLPPDLLLATGIQIDLTIEETDPVFSAWDKSTGISITESQISDLGDYQEELVNEVNIKSINSQSILGSGDIEISYDSLEETDPAFSAWDKSTGITITESQISDFGNYQEQLISGTNIKTINGQDITTGTPVQIYANELTSSEVIQNINNQLGSIDWQQGSTTGEVEIGDVVSTYNNNVDSSWLPCDGSTYEIEDYPTLANVMELIDMQDFPDELYGFGQTRYGQLGLGLLGYSSEVKTEPTMLDAAQDWNVLACGASYSLIIKNDGTLWGTGANSYGQLWQYFDGYISYPAQIGTDNDWIKIEAGESHTLAIKNDNSLWAWGRNNYGQLGLNDITNYSSPVQVGTDTDWDKIECGQYHTAAIKTDGTLWTWGYNQSGQLGQNNITNYSSPVQVGSLTDWVNVACGGGHTLAIRNDNSLWAWGSNDNGQLGLGNTTDYSSPVQVGSLTDWADISCGWDHTIGIKTDGTLWGWGLNNYGQVGNGNTFNQSYPVQISVLNNWKKVACGNYYYSIAIRENGSLWSWGYNQYGQLGQGDTVHRSVPTQVGNLNIWNEIASGNYHVIMVNGDRYTKFLTPDFPIRDNENWYIKAL